MTNHGEDTWRDLAAVLTTAASASDGRNDKNDQHHDFPIHVMVADPKMTVCDEESIWLMKKIMKNKGQVRTGTGRHVDDVNVDFGIDNDNTSTADTGLRRFLAMHRYKGAVSNFLQASVAVL